MLIRSSDNPQAQRSHARRFVSDIAAALLIKLIGLVLLYYFFSALTQRPVLTDASVAQHLLHKPGQGVNHD
jgi:membrane-anchored protein YejM (alkaline phosphatase superfamily)